MLPDWEVGTPAVLIVAGPHAIPVSTAVRRGNAAGGAPRCVSGQSWPAVNRASASRAPCGSAQTSS